MWSPLKEFRILDEELQVRHTFKLFVSGQTLSKERRNALNNILRWCLKHKKAQGPETIGRFLAREIIRAAETNQTVGKNIMCTFVPRAFVNDTTSIHIGTVEMEVSCIKPDSTELRPKEIFRLHERLAIIHPFDRPRIAYINGDNSPLPYHAPIYVRPGAVISAMKITGMSVTAPPLIQA